MQKKPMIASALVAGAAIAAVAVPVAEGTTAHSATASQGASGATGAHGMPGPGGPPGGPPGPGPLHAVSVVLNKAHTGFITLTTDSGTIQSVDGTAGTITLVEGTKTLKYKTVTLTIPAGATVLLDGKSSSLGALTSEDHVTVTSSSEGTTVFAVDSSFHPERAPGAGGPPSPPGGYPGPGGE